MSDQYCVDDFEVFSWNKNFETGIHEVDEQHKKLVELLNHLANTLAQEEPLEINQAFEALAKYADYHFESEEAVWAEYFNDDPWFFSHQLTHSSFLPKVLELQEKDKNKPLQIVVEDIMKFLIRWLAFHILDDDKRLAVAIEAMASGSSLDEAKVIADRKMSDSVLIDTIMTMYDRLSSRTLNLMRERNARLRIEAELREVNKKLEKLSITDQLTDIYNRRYFDSVINDELKRICIHQTSLSLILFDIDYFKKLNDRYGHSSGDEALHEVGKALKILCQRDGDYAFRLGGEEFAVISADMPGKAERVSGESIRRCIENLRIPNKDSAVSNYMTVSVGELVVESHDDHDINGLMKQADKCLYAAKNGGRNQVIAFEECDTAL